MKATKKKISIRWWVWLILILVGVVLMMTANKLRQSEHPDPITTIQTYYETKEGVLRMYPERDEFLSESMGQYLIYLEAVENQALFKQTYQVMKSHFVEQSFIKWRTTDTTVDAIVDTFRVIEALKRAAITFDQPMYLEEAYNYQDALKEAHYQNGFYVDFYDWYYDDIPSTMHLSYQDISILTDMGVNLTDYRQLFSEAENEPFFNEVYNVETKTFEQKDTAHLVDQLLIAQNYVKLTNQPPDAFHRWIIAEYNNSDQLSGQYDRQTKKPVVNYESMAVNGLFLDYLLLTNENGLAKDVYQKLNSQIKEVHEENYEGVHIFDYLMAVQAVVDYEKK
ncbi:hypothetical protein SAMN05421839_10543 [Halolactibacillus halophilus]|uniref:Glycosyl hydrolases family 8 n=2 Tax=Halolactibacillus halophilus TaxID=306540 RepID=A0A1I5MDT8_9BACI|nr:hypothetical protein SAMN05421839_10543 [Halolactibacillus halophilus]